MLDVGQVVPPGPGRPQGVRVHDAQVLARLEVAAGAQGDLRIHRTYYLRQSTQVYGS